MMKSAEEKASDIHARIMEKCNAKLEESDVHGKLDFIIRAISTVIAEELDTLDRKKADYRRKKR